MENKVTFRREGHDRLVDFIKGLAIIGVILLHNLGHYRIGGVLLFNLWIGMSVPLFVLIQSLNTYRGYLNQKTIVISDYFRSNTWKMFKRVFVPFVYSQVVVVMLYMLFDGDVNNLFRQFLCQGGLGPGSYYPWAYLQIYMLLPFVIWLYKRIGVARSYILWMCVSIFLEFYCSFSGMIEAYYRLLAVRYIFLMICGIHLMAEGVTMNKKTMIASIAGACFIVIDTYTPVNFFPIAYKSEGFLGQHWIAYFYVSTLLILMIKNVHVMFEKYHIVRLIECYGRDSYSIFIIQLVVFWIFRTLHYDSYDISLYTFVFTLLTTTLPLVYSTYKYCIKQNQEKM